MEKRLPLALFLSFLVLLGWSLMTPKRQPDPALSEPLPAAAPAAADEGAGEETLEAAPALGEVVVADAEQREKLLIGVPGERGSYLAEFTNRGAALVNLWLGDSYDQPSLSDEEKADQEHWTQLLRSVPRKGGGSSSSLRLSTQASSEALVRGPLEDALWRMEVLGGRETPRGVEFTLAPGSGVRFVKRVRFVPDSYQIEIDLEVHNDAFPSEKPATFTFTPALVVPRESQDNFYAEPQAVAARVRDRDLPKLLAKPMNASAGPERGTFDVPGGELSFAGVQNKYFAVLLRGSDATSQATLGGALWRRLPDEEFIAEGGEPGKSWRYMATDVLLNLQVPAIGQSRQYTYGIYAGPKAPSEMAAVSPALGAILEKDLGWFDGIASLLLSVLNFFQRLVGNWGVAIILLTLSVRALLFPLNRRMQTSMARFQTKMKRVQPKIDELKKKYEKDPQKLRQEQALLMQKEGAFPPLGGCLPMFLQLPVFFGLFSALRTSFDLRQAPFVGWIQDLSRPDQLMRLDFNTHLPFIGTIEYLNVLPPLMVVLWVWQQRTMPTPADEQAARMQRMMMFMPIMMGFFLYNYAAGLSLYMITQSGLGIIEQRVIKKLWPIDETEKPKKKEGFMARLAEKHQEQLKQLQAQQARKQRSKAKARRR